MQQTPFDNIDLKDLDGWIHYDSSRMRKENKEKDWEGIHEIDIRTLGYALIMVETVTKND